MAIILTGQKEKDFKSDYDLWFVCSLNIDIDKTPVNKHLKNKNEKSELINLLWKNACCENNQFQLFIDRTHYALNKIESISSFIIEDNLLNSYKKTYLYPSRSPPAMA
ncbi:MAG: hypothetical protein ACR2NW_08875 [Thermodesulfobacteriota bacterium]